MSEGSVELSQTRRAAVFSRGIARLPHLDLFLGLRAVHFRPHARQAHCIDIVLTWGNKTTGRAAENYARDHGLPLLRLEDGFFRSMQPGTVEPPLSLVADDLGIYYDATHPSRLEVLVANDGRLDDADALERASAALTFVRQERISKYNNGVLGTGGRSSGGARVLLVDQTAGDASLRYGLTSADTPLQMLTWARQEFPHAELILKTHPDVAKGLKKSLFLTGLAQGDLRGVRLHTEVTNAHLLLEEVDHVITATSQLGFEALLHGRPVTCFGAPFYAGWGLTDDRIPIPRRGIPRTVEQLALAAWFLYPTYVHPTYQRRCEPEEILQLLALQLRRREGCRGRTLAVGFSGWKRKALRPFLEAPGSQVEPVRASQLGSVLERTGADRVVVWGQRLDAAQERQVRDRNVLVERLEDGFLRSNRLGSDLTVPASIVRDRTGIYFDPSRPSDLETLLNERRCSSAELERACRLRERLVRAGLTKYNVQREASPEIEPRGRTVVLVVGQVDNDASVLLGGGPIRSSGELVEVVRACRPDAFLLFKPHPDVVAGNRPGQLTPDQLRLVDHVEEHASSLACLAVAQEVHTLTSLLGFEALLRTVPVFTYGLPFYAGWGLTQDRLHCARRTRRLTLPELIFHALIAYPLYVNPRTGYYAEVEEVVFELQQHRARHGSPAVRASIGRQLARAWRYFRGGFRAG